MEKRRGKKSLNTTGLATRGISHYGLAIYIKKYLKAKRRIMETQLFSPCKNYNLKNKKNPLKETKILQEIITLELISSFNRSQNYHASKNPHIKK
jgi:hypothetical protein